MKDLIRKSFFLLIGFATLATVHSAQAQDDGTQYGANPSDCRMNISLYRESFKQWEATNYESNNLDEIIVPWRKCFTDCPRGSEYIYLNGVKIYEYLISKETNPEIKEKLVDTLEMVFDNRIKYFPTNKSKQSQEGNILWRKAISLAQVMPSRLETIYNDLKRSVELDGNATSSTPLPIYFKATIDMANNEKIDKSVIIETYDQLMSIIDFNYNGAKAANNTKEMESWDNTRRLIEQAVEPYASCDDLVEIFKKKFETNPNDLETLQKITTALDKSKCTDSDLFMQATENLFKLDPTPQAAYMMAKIYTKNEEYDKAAKSLQEVVKLTDDNDLKADAELALAQIYMVQKKYAQAREHARRALQLRPNNGEPLLLIGRMYAASSELCEGDEIAKKAIFWAAVDKFMEAKRIDANTAQRANELIAAYRKYFPSNERIFFHTLTEGDAYKIECWIQETTTIRALAD